MFNVNSSFFRFFSLVQEALGMELDLKALSPHACLVYGNKLDINIIYYRLEAGERTTAGETGKREIHLDEDMWIRQPDLLLRRIAALAGQATRVHARDTVLTRIDKQVAMAFQQEHHLNVPLPGKYRYGLYLDGELAATAVFSGGRRMQGKPEEYRSFELLRFCHKQGLHVVGGLSKLVEGFRKDFEPGDIMTYADKDWTDGQSYQKTGFEIVGELSPRLFWVDPKTWARHAADSLPEGLAGKTDETLRAEGYLPLHSSGSLKLVKQF